MTRSHKEVEILIIKLEQSLREALLWSSFAPSVEDLQSKLPFALDTMPFEQWLQFVFIPKMSEIVNTQGILPENMHLLPMAEQCFITADKQSAHMQVIKQIDLIFATS
ncbi:MAG: hypothetical protein ACI9LX_002755 [Paraglaciecola sp.]|jgi:uncharacterized protein YqcC (DUF446 family)